MQNSIKDAYRNLQRWVSFCFCNNPTTKQQVHHQSNPVTCAVVDYSVKELNQSGSRKSKARLGSAKTAWACGHLVVCTKVYTSKPRFRPGLHWWFYVMDILGNGPRRQDHPASICPASLGRFLEVIWRTMQGMGRLVPWLHTYRTSALWTSQCTYSVLWTRQCADCMSIGRFRRGC